VTEDVNPLTERIEHDSVGPAIHIDRLDSGKGLCIPHHDGLAGCEAVIGLRIDSLPVGAEPRYFGNGFQGVEIKYRNPRARTAASNIETPVV